MSLRNLRKVTGDTNALPPPDEDEEYEPIYTKNVVNNFKFLGIESGSDQEQEQPSESDDAEDSPVHPKKKNNKKKQRKNKSTKKNVTLENAETLDEIDKVVMEVNAMLGPPVAPPEPPAPPPVDPRQVIMAVQHKHLNAEDEMDRLFGPDEEEAAAKRRAGHNSVRRFKRSIVLPDVSERQKVHFHGGLSMSIEKREDDYIYFTFDHNKEVQKMHHVLLLSRNGRWVDTTVARVLLSEPTNSHVEGMLDTIDVLFSIEQYSIAKTLVEQALDHMQKSAHYLFNVTNPKVRLEYKYRENRPYHILVLKYLYLVTNRACHRTALELAKVLLTLDPSDPLAVMLIIDVLALRAREHQWLIDAVVVWTKERNADCLFNMQYSNAMAHFHVIKKKKGDMAVADKLLQMAIFSFPTVAMKLFECTSVSIDAKIKDHQLFKESDTTKNLQDLITLYAKLCWSRWKENDVMAWLKRNVNEVVKQYDENPTIKDLVLQFKNKRLNLFQAWPKELVRHFSVIQPMAQLLVDGAVPNMSRPCPFNPAPPHDSIDRNQYDPPPLNNHLDSHNLLFELFSSLMPAHNPYERDEPYIFRELPERNDHVHLPNNQPVPYEFEPNLDANLERLMNVGDEDIPIEEDPNRNNLINTAGDLRNALVSFLREVFANIYSDEPNVEPPAVLQERQLPE